MLAVVTPLDAPARSARACNTARLLGGAEIEHYHQAIAVVVAETFEQARAAAALVRVDYARGRAVRPRRGRRRAARRRQQRRGQRRHRIDRVGDFETAFAAAPVTLDATYTTPDQSHVDDGAARHHRAWDGDKLTLWTSNQMIAWGEGDLAETLGIPQEKVRSMSPFVGGGFGGKLFVRADAVLAALGARAAGRPVKVALTRPHDPQQHHAPPGHDPAHPARRDARRHASPRSRTRAVGQPAGRHARDGGRPDQAALRRRQPPDLDAARRARPARGQRDARAGRGARADGARDRHGRDGREARHGPGRVPHQQRHAGRSREARAAVLRAPARRVPAAGRRALRLGRRNPSRARCATGAGWSAWAWPRASATTC